jgi:hypothetical protein
MTSTTAGSESGYVAGMLRRPGWVTFAAVVTFVVAAFYGLLALTEFANSYWFYGNLATNVYNLASSHLLWWGIFDTIIAVIAVTAAVSMLRGGVYGLVIGLFSASVSFLRWFFYIPSEPWLSITVIVIDALVIYGLCASMDFFEQSETL